MIEKNHQNPALTIIKLGAELGLVAQLVERRLCKAEALGPNPSKSIESIMHTLRPTRCGRVEVRTRKVRSCEAVHKLCDQTLTEFSGA